jgi:hypothetical protein
VFNIETVGPGEDAYVPDAGPACSTATFDNGIDPLVAVERPTSAVTVVAQDGALVITPPAMTSGHIGVVTPLFADLTAGFVQVEVPSGLTMDQGDTHLVIAPDVNDVDNQFLIYMTTQFVGFRKTVNGVRTDGGTSYSAVFHRFWRVRFADPDVVIETAPSADGPWTDQFTHASEVPLTQLYVEIAAGMYTPDHPQPGAAKFDNLRICTEPP